MTVFLLLGDYIVIHESFFWVEQKQPQWLQVVILFF